MVTYYDVDDHVYSSRGPVGFSKENVMSIACEFFESHAAWEASIHPTGLALFIENENDKRYKMKVGSFTVTFSKEILEAA